MKTIKAEDIPADASALGEFLQSLDVSNGEIVFEQDGEPRLVLVSAKILRQRKQAKEQLFALIHRLRQQHPDLDSDDVLRESEELDQPQRAVP